MERQRLSLSISIVPALKTYSRLVVASAFAGLTQWGCMESTPGAAQTHSALKVAAMRAESPDNPQCRDATVVLVLDKDAIPNGRNCQCARRDGDDDDNHDEDYKGSHGGDRDRDHDKDGRSSGGGGNGGSGGGGGDGRGNVVAANNLGIGCQASQTGYRGTVDYFAKNVGQEITLPSGELGNEGWFAVTLVRIGWRAAGPDSGDGLRNFIDAGPGLGSPDAKGNKESLLENVPDLTPLRATGLLRLTGRSICAVVLDGDVQMKYSPLSGNIKGPDLGKVAFQVLGTEPGNGGSKLPGVRVRILDAEAVCSDPLTVFADAPKTASNCAPRDVERPACAVQRTLINEPWNTFDTTVWQGDGDQEVDGGFFFAREGASSAAADWISPCPVVLDSLSAIRFTNRLQLNSSQQSADFAQSGALFMVNVDGGGAFEDYAFVNVGYTVAPSKVFVETFGSDHGVDFDQFEETSLAYQPSQIFSLDMWIRPHAYQLAVAGEMVDTVNLTHALASLDLFEVGVQQGIGGLRGLVDMTAITQQCASDNTRPSRSHASCKGRKRERVGQHCRTRNDYVRAAKEAIQHCRHPSAGLRCLAAMKERPDFD